MLVRAAACAAAGLRRRRRQAGFKASDREALRRAQQAQPATRHSTVSRELLLFCMSNILQSCQERLVGVRMPAALPFPPSSDSASARLWRAAPPALWLPFHPRPSASNHGVARLLPAQALLASGQPPLWARLQRCPRTPGPACHSPRRRRQAPPRSRRQGRLPRGGAPHRQAPRRSRARRTHVGSAPRGPRLGLGRQPAAGAAPARLLRRHMRHLHSCQSCLSPPF